MKRLFHATLFGLLLAVALPAAAVSYLWEVSSLTNKVYLFGTVHAGMPSWYPLEHEIEHAFDISPVLVVEADITNADAIEKSTRAMTYTPPANLRTHIPAEDYARFRRLLDKYRIPEDAVVNMKPFMASSLLVFGEWSRLGYSPAMGVDGYLLQKAKEKGKRIEELEGVDTQIALMDSLDNDETLALFRGTLDALESGLTAEQVNGLVHAWQDGDPNALLDVARRYNDKVPGAAAFEEKFIWSRHPAMVAKISDMLEKTRERHFIAVGALHLAGPKGLVELLRRKGYVVKQL
jgi:uncharacterized protein YbaP (TraB family)